MRKFNRRSRRALSFRLFFVLAGAWLLLAALAPSANAQNVLLYFNFEDVPIGIGAYDHDADVQPAYGGDNPGGGVQNAFIQDSFIGAGTGTAIGTTVNRTAGDIDTSTLRGLGLRTTPIDNGNFIQIRSPTPLVGFDASAWSNMSLSFAINTQGNGFNSVTLSYSITPGHLPGTFVDFATQAIPAGGGYNAFTFAVPAAVDHQPDVILRLTFTGGTSNGNNLQTFIDNIQLTGVPEPTTVAGGLLGVLGLCWHQRRRLRLILPRSRRA